MLKSSKTCYTNRLVADSQSGGPIAPPQRGSSLATGTEKHRMSSQLVSDASSDQAFRLIPLTGPPDPGVSPGNGKGEIPVFDLTSEEPLPEIPEDGGVSPLSTSPAFAALLPPPAGEGEMLTGEAGMWMEGDVLMCACPDCRAPMSIRLWLMIADCWHYYSEFRSQASLERFADEVIYFRPCETDGRAIYERVEAIADSCLAVKHFRETS